MIAPLPPSPRLRIGLLLDSPFAPNDVREFVRWAQQHPGLELTHLVLRAPPERSSGPLSGLLFKTIVAIEMRLLARSDRYRDARQTFDISPLLPNQIRLGGPASGAHDADRLKPLGLDLLVAFGGEPPHELAAATRFGTVFLEYGDGRGQPDRLAGFWEVYSRQDTTSFAVCRDTPDGVRETAMRGRVGTEFYHLLNQAALRERAGPFLKTLVERIAATHEPPPALPQAGTAGARTEAPSAAQCVSYLARQLWFIGLRTTRRALRIDSRWSVGFVRTPWQDADHARATVIQNPPGRYLADPFVVSRDGKDVCYVEDYDIAAQLGRISAYDISSDAPAFLGVVLDEPFHLSFPYLFEYRGALFMCPETSGNNDIRIYRCIDFPLRWTLEKVIMKDVSAVDSMLFEKAGRWWLLTNIDPARTGDFFQLHVFSAETPFDDHWTPHPRNPIHVDATLARNGGLVRDGERVFRNAQAQGFDFYGKSLSINEIVELNALTYAERRVRTITPTFRSGVAGTHHLHSNGTLTVFDFARITGRG